MVQERVGDKTVIVTIDASSDGYKEEQRNRVTAWEGHGIKGFFKKMGDVIAFSMMKKMKHKGEKNQ